MSELSEANDNEIRQRLKKTINTIEKESQYAENNVKKEQTKHVKSKQIIKFNYQRFWTRVMIVLSISILVYITSTRTKEKYFAREKEFLPYRYQSLICTNKENYVEMCSTIKCGRFVRDNIVTESHVSDIEKFVEKIMKISSSNSGLIKLNLHTGHLSNDSTDNPNDFINIHKPDKEEFIHGHKSAIHNSYLWMLDYLKNVIQESFSINVNNLYVAQPTYFQKVTNSTIINKNNEYWHLNNNFNTNYNEDTNATRAQHITVILYFQNYNKNFTGGRFLFNDGNISNNKNQLNNQLKDQYNKTLTIIEPKRGRFIVFTNGNENLYNFEKIIYGELLTLIITFTCDPNLAIDLKNYPMFIDNEMI